MSVCESGESAAIVGLGLIGGSLARDLSARGVRVSAYDANPGRLAAAVHERIVACPLDENLRGVESARVIVVAVPVDSAVDVLGRIAPYAANAALVTDVGSTKTRIGRAAVELGLGPRFVGSHPMAGDHRSGWEASRTGLFAEARVYLCPALEAMVTAKDLATAFWRALGACPVDIDAEEHDRKLAWASHLPHVISAALAGALARGGIHRHDLGPGGRDVTRLAGSSPDLWAAIVRDNAGAIDAALAAAEREIAGFRDALSQQSNVDLRRRFADARVWFDE